MKLIYMTFKLFPIHLLWTMCFLLSCDRVEKVHYKENGAEVFGYLHEDIKLGEWNYLSAKGDTLKTEWYDDNGNLKLKKLYANTTDSRYLMIETKIDNDSTIEENVYYPSGQMQSRTFTDDSIHYQRLFFENGRLKLVGKIKDSMPCGSFWQYFENGQLQMYSPNAGNDSTYIFDSLGNFVVNQVYKNYELQLSLEEEINIENLPKPPLGNRW